jgi:hypothetical protein
LLGPGLVGPGLVGSGLVGSGLVGGCEVAQPLGVAVFQAALPAGGELGSDSSALCLACSYLRQAGVGVGEVWAFELLVGVGRAGRLCGLARRCHDR